MHLIYFKEFLDAKGRNAYIKTGDALTIECVRFTFLMTPPTPPPACPPHRIGLDIRHDAGKGSSIRTSMVLNDNSNSFCCAGISLLDTKTSATASMQNVGGLVTLKKGDKVTIGKKHWAGGITISDWSVFRQVCKCYPWQQTSTTKRLRLPFVLFLNVPKSLNSTDKD